MKHLIPVIVILLLASTSFVGVGNQVKELMVDMDVKQPINSSGGPADSPWPMKCHDTHHTGRSEYRTANNSYHELWSYKFEYNEYNDPVIGEDGIIYVSGSFEDMVYGFVAINPNGTLRWRYQVDGQIWHMCPTIAEDGTIYFGCWDNCLYSLNPNGTREWKFNAGCMISSDPAIGNDGTIYFGTGWCMGSGCKIFAVNPDGSEKWRYKTGDYVSSDPAIGDDGTIYIGSGDSYLYAMNPNGTVKWRFNTGEEIYAPPSIADDGTIYISSFDDYLYAIYPNGTLRWKINTEYGSCANPSIGSDGTIYICSASKMFAINPEDGAIKWELNLGGDVLKSSSAICADGIIYTGIEIGNCKGGEIVAVNPDGTLRGRMRLSNCRVDSSPCIGEDGIIYVVSTSSNPYSTLHAITLGSDLGADANGPYYGLADIPVAFSGTVSGHPPYSRRWDFGDGDISYEENPSHIYENPGKYIVTLNVSDNTGNSTENVTWAWIQESNSPPGKPSITGETRGKKDIRYNYTFKSSDPDESFIWLSIDWGDGFSPKWYGPYQSGEEITISSEWNYVGWYTIRCKARDPYGAESDWATLTVRIPHITCKQLWLFNGLLERFPLLQRLLERLFL